MGISKQILLNADTFVGTWVAGQLGNGAVYRPADGDKAIGLIDPDKGLIAGVLYQNFNGVNISAHIAAVPGANWLTRNFLWVMFDYPFNQLGVKRITGVVPASNLAARRFDEHLGFVHEATLKDALPDGDLLLYVMWRENCRWLALKEKVHGIGNCR